MDIVEFAEQETGTKLCEWQKCVLRDVYNIYLSKRNKLHLVMHPHHGRSYYLRYLEQNNLPICKELIQNGSTPENYR